ncbi:hypothetical protein J2W28_005939 [Variovorax boronicumulans]|uniref:DUF5710 domain-containing protein n=1 Tax=Variovorax boronicumulans TaxID=436515 RepID=UPI00278A1556|nr:DUF5710 domain-containing protein [Variovorax boronicumulans]MDP9995769.1 hypothetical protein [Variovorax boronicumulans]MDQ0006766.1 hypothetical protein [Variovorax boronicumulans]
MSRQYLDVPYRSKDAAKALGARFDGTVKRWYVEAGVDLVAFSAWLPAGTAPSGSASRGIALADETAAGVVAVKSGISLSRLLNGVAAAVAQALASSVWKDCEELDAGLG